MNGIKNKDLKRRILEISYKKNLSHIGSCITAVDIIDEIYAMKKPDEKFVLSSGHAGLALYCVLEKYSGTMLDAEYVFDKIGVHPDRLINPFKPDAINGGSPFFISPINCSSGSLGHGLGIAVGLALADRSRNVYCLISDGEYAEGSIHEALRVMYQQKLDNLKVYMNDNGWGAYGESYLGTFPGFIQMRFTNMTGWPKWLQGQQAHYVVMDEKMYQEALGVVK